ncbi:hypothetical protein [Actinomadura bangladeshensis]|uniref:Uncharacterized protein n=1 Tax=Actinomadura bangladeshensis TaxID=453573 RepID=A0A4R4NUH9_9ACTN|nr:hypothetical protein [Actinomadura bangladeshensis]TDC12684.1 hypothetical protein E1284_22690 [Actinomadura bangladeshensis]
MRTLSNRVLLLFASAMLVLLPFGAVTAQADEVTWTVIDGGRTDAYGGLAAQTTSGGAASCSSSNLIVRFRDGTGLSGTSLIMITYGTLSNCEASGLPIEIHPRGLPWKMNATSYDPQTGTTTGTLTSDDAAGISAVVTLDSLGCELAVGGPGTDKGEIQATYTNSTGQLFFSDANLVITSVGLGCPVVSLGDQLTVFANYYVVPAPTITNP